MGFEFWDSSALKKTPRLTTKRSQYCCSERFSSISLTFRKKAWGSFTTILSLCENNPASRFENTSLKIALVQDLSGRDIGPKLGIMRTIMFQDMLRNVYHEIVVIFSEKAHFHLSGAVNNNIKVQVRKQPPGMPSINDTPKPQSNNVVRCFKFWSLILRLLFWRKRRVRPCTVISHQYCAIAYSVTSFPQILAII